MAIEVMRIIDHSSPCDGANCTNYAKRVNFARHSIDLHFPVTAARGCCSNYLPMKLNGDQYCHLDFVHPIRDETTETKTVKTGGVSDSIALDYVDE